MDTRSTSIVLEDRQALKIYCAQAGMTMTEFINLAIRNEIDRRKVK